MGLILTTTFTGATHTHTHTHMEVEGGGEEENVPHWDVITTSYLPWVWYSSVQTSTLAVQIACSWDFFSPQRPTGGWKSWQAAPRFQEAYGAILMPVVHAPIRFVARQRRREPKNSQAARGQYPERLPARRRPYPDSSPTPAGTRYGAMFYKLKAPYLVQTQSRRRQYGGYPT